MRKKMKKKLNTSQGFTLAEVLVATIILLLAAEGLTVGIKMAVDHYDEQRVQSESKVLFSTLQDTINYELMYTGMVEYASKSGGTYIIKDFYSTTYHISSSYSAFSSLDGSGAELDTGGGYLALGSSGSDPYEGKKLIGDASYTFNMGARVTNLKYIVSGTQSYFMYTLTVYDEDDNVLITDEVHVIPGNELEDNGSGKLVAD